LTVRPIDLGVADKPVALVPPADPRDNGHRLGEDRVKSVLLVSLEAFAAVDEPGAEALVGGEDAALIPEGGDVLIYGDGGAGKTTLSIDLACHLGAGKDWLGIPVPRRARVLLIENEGPRALFRRKLRRKLDGWAGPTLDGHISVFQQPWGEFSFADGKGCSALAAAIAEDEIDVLIVGPVTRSGMNEAGTLHEVRDFMALVAEVRAGSGRRLTIILIHHENKGGTVSGAWEGSGDTLLHVEARGNGYTRLHVEKARWSSAHHKATFELVWTAGDGFAIKDERNLAVEIEELLGDGRWRTAKETAASKDAQDPGVGANVDAVKAELAGQPDRFISRTGDEAREVGRHANATVWSLTRASESDRADSGAQGCGGERLTSDSPLESQTSSGPHPPSQAKLTQTPESHTDRDYQRLQQRLRALNALPEAEAEAEWQLIAERGTLPTDPDLELSRLTAKYGDLGDDRNEATT
jgi:hypothetical protein